MNKALTKHENEMGHGWKILDKFVHSKQQRTDHLHHHDHLCSSVYSDRKINFLKDGHGHDHERIKS